MSKITGAWVITEIETGQVVHRIESRQKPHSQMWDLAEEGICRRLDNSRYLFKWEDAE